MVQISVSVVRRPDGPRKGRNGKEITLLGPAKVSVPANFSSNHNAPPSFFGPYHFAFWSVVGAQPEPFVWFNPSVPITTGATDVVAKAWFVADDPKPATGTGVLVDAFAVDTGGFLDDDFVTVTDAKNAVDANRTDEGNTSGLVRTATLAGVEAATDLAGTAFDNWVCVTGTEPLNGQMLTAEKGSNADAIAFYKGPAPEHRPLFAPDRFFAERAWVSWGVAVDGGGPWGGGPPIGPWDPLMVDLAAGLAMAEAAQKLDPTLRAEALDLAAHQVSLAAEAIAEAIRSAGKRTKRR